MTTDSKIDAMARDYALSVWGPSGTANRRANAETDYKAGYLTALPKWQPIESAPKGKKIIVGYWNALGKWRTITARYYKEGTLERSKDDPDDEEPYAPEGWYEESETIEHILATDEPPTHWMPLPKPPEDV